MFTATTVFVTIPAHITVFRCNWTCTWSRPSEMKTKLTFKSIGRIVMMEGKFWPRNWDPNFFQNDQQQIPVRCDWRAFGWLFNDQNRFTYRLLWALMNIFRLPCIMGSEHTVNERDAQHCIRPKKFLFFLVHFVLSVNSPLLARPHFIQTRSRTYTKQYKLRANKVNTPLLNDDQHTHGGRWCTVSGC